MICEGAVKNVYFIVGKKCNYNTSEITCIPLEQSVIQLQSCSY